MQSRNAQFALIISAAVLLIAPLRVGDLAGYDDATYSLMAKSIAISGDWLTPRSNGYPVVEHPPLFPWIQAAFFQVFGINDFAARLPSALCGAGVIGLTGVLAGRLLGNAAAFPAAFVMATSLYFLKYASRAMTDVPFALFFLLSICAWIRSDVKPRWLLAAGLFAGCAQMTRGLMGLALPAIFILDAALRRRRPPLRMATPAFVLAFLPIVLWYALQLSRDAGFFVAVHDQWLRTAVYGELTPAWRRFTGAPEYAWMLLKSYWPWLPFAAAGAVFVWRRREERGRILLIWVGVVFALCAVNRSRVLRYMLPAYPAFAVLASHGMLRIFRPGRLEHLAKFAAPAYAAVAIAIAIVAPARHHAATTRPIAAVLDRVLQPGERAAFYDQGQPRFDETNQLQWYSRATFVILTNRAEFERTLASQAPPRIWVSDRNTCRELGRRCDVLAESGHLVVYRFLLAQQSYDRPRESGSLRKPFRREPSSCSLTNRAPAAPPTRDRAPA